LKKTILVFLAALLLLPAGNAAAADAPPETAAKAMIVLHGASGRVLAEKNADEPMLIASTTKLMTALVAAEDDLARETEIQPAWTTVEGSSMYLRAGERYTLYELLQGLLLASGNDAALAIAETVSGSETAFVERMNARAEELGLTHTHFVNPHGLDAEGHGSTARDLAMLMSAVMDCVPLREILGTRSCSIHNKYYVNHNKLLGKCPGVNGGKTGYTMAAGRCLVTSCQRDGLELICVTLSDPTDWEDHASLYDWAYESFGAFSVGEEIDLPAVPLISAARAEAQVSLAETPVLCLDKDSRVTVRVHLPPFVFAPIRQGASAGTAEILSDGRRIWETPLVWAENAGVDIPTG